LPLRRGLALLLGRGLTLSLFSGLGPSLGRGLTLPAICGFGMHRTCEDNRVKAQSSREGGDPSESGHHILAASQHQTAVHHYPEQLLVGPHGDLPHHLLRWQEREPRAVNLIMLLTLNSARFLGQMWCLVDHAAALACAAR
jgi:hypothetical protein